MTLSELYDQIRIKRSFLCIGLDVDLDRVPESIRNQPVPIFKFCKEIVDATHEYAIAYKPNIAFFEAYGSKGWSALERLMDYIKSNYPEIFTIADAKRCDIGNSSVRYAVAFFNHLKFDAITLSPYMGRDSIEPFLRFPDKHVILLALTSNHGALDFQLNGYGENSLYLDVIRKSQEWSGADRILYVVGATKPQYFKKIRSIVPNSFLLVPGIGAQGGSLESVVESGFNSRCGLIVNSSRAIIYAKAEKSFKNVLRAKAEQIQSEMRDYVVGILE